MTNDGQEVNEEILLALADDMAAAATSFNSQGYDVFIQSRERLKTYIHSLFVERSPGRSRTSILL